LNLLLGTLQFKINLVNLYSIGSLEIQ